MTHVTRSDLMSNQLVRAEILLAHRWLNCTDSTDFSQNPCTDFHFLIFFKDSPRSFSTVPNECSKFTCNFGFKNCPKITGNRQECSLSLTSSIALPAHMVTGLKGCQSHSARVITWMNSIETLVHPNGDLFFFLFFFLKEAIMHRPF